MKLTSIVFFLLLFIVVGCAGTGKLMTESGKPEILILNKTDSVANYITNWAPTKGQIVQSFSGNLVNTSSSVDVPTGLGMTQNVGARTVYNVVKIGKNCKVYALRFIAASKQPFGYYQVMPASSVLTNEFNTQDAYDTLQKELEDLAQFVKNN